MVQANGTAHLTNGIGGSNDKKQKHQDGIDLVFRDVTVTMGHAEVLHDVSGVVRRGQLLALMGPSGAGKTTLLNALAGRTPLTSGEITLNNQPITKRLRRNLAYVLQQDIFFQRLTLRQTLTFAAMLRLPDKMKKSEKMKCVHDIVDTLDLHKCLDTVMGGLFMPGLSGGEKRRASIACELLTNPKLLLLDEPTSGLDSAIAYSMMTTLKTYTQMSNKTVVTTIHQPSSAMFHMFDQVLLLVDGHVAYYGSGSKILDFFSSVGLHCRPNYNPADFILEKVKESKESAEKVIAAAYKHRKSDDWPLELRSEADRGPEVVICNGENGHAIGNITKGPGAIDLDWDPNSLPEDELDKLYDPNKKWPTGFWTQYTTLTHRNLLQSRGRILSVINIVQTVGIAIIVSLLWFRLPRTELTLNDRIGLLFFLVVYWGFFSMFDIVTTFPLERPVVKKERAAGAYRVSAYYCAKITSELPLLLLQPLVFYSIVHWVTNMDYNFFNFLACMGTLLLSAMASQSYGLFIGAVTPDISTGIMVGSVLMLGSMLAGGYYQKNVPPYFFWLKYVSYIHYAYHALVVIELGQGEPLECLPANATAFPQCSQPSNETLYIQGIDILEAQKISTDLWFYYLLLVVIIIVFRFLGYLGLRFFNSTGKGAPKQRKMKKSPATKKENSFDNIGVGQKDSERGYTNKSFVIESKETVNDSGDFPIESEEPVSTDTEDKIVCSSRL